MKDVNELGLGYVEVAETVCNKACTMDVVTLIM